MDLNFKVEGQILSCTNMQEIVTDSVKYIYANFTFSSDWDGRGKTAEFKNSNIDQGYVKTITDNKCEVPPEVMVKDGKLTVCVKGAIAVGKSQSVVYTMMRNPLRLRVSNKTDCVNSQDPTPDEITQLEILVGHVQSNLDVHVNNTNNPHATNKIQIGLGNVTNDRQVKGLPSGITNGNLVKFGTDGYTVADSGESVSTLKKDTTANILNPTLKTTVLKGITCTANGDGTYTLNGAATSNVSFNYNNYVALPNIYGGLKFLGCSPDGSPTTYTSIVSYYDGTTWKKEEYEYGNGIVINGSYNIVQFGIYIISGAILDNVIFKPMLTTNLSATYDDFVPFTGTSGQLNKDVAAHETSISTLKNKSTSNMTKITSGNNIVLTSIKSNVKYTLFFEQDVDTGFNLLKNSIGGGSPEFVNIISNSTKAMATFLSRTDCNLFFNGLTSKNQRNFVVVEGVYSSWMDFVPYTGTSGQLNKDVAAHETSISSIKNDIADQYSVSSTYAIGDLVIYNNSLYKCNTAITVAEAWTVGHWTATTLDAEIITNKNAIATTNTNMAQLLAVQQFTASTGTVNANTYGQFYIPVAKEGYTALAVVGASSQTNCPLVAVTLQTNPQVQVYVCVRNVTTSAMSGVAPYVNVLFMKNLS